MGNCNDQHTTPDEPLLTRRQVRLIGYLTLCVALAWLMVRCRSVFPVFVLGFLLAYLFDPILDRLQEKGWSRSYATFLVFGALMICLALVALFVVPVIVGQVSDLVVNVDAYTAQFHKLATWVEIQAIRLNASEKTLETIRSGWEKLAGYGVMLAPKAGAWLVDSIGNLLVLLILPIITYYYMQEIDPIRARIRHLLPVDYAADIINISGDINRMLGRYIRGQVTVCLLLGLATTGVLLIFTAVFHMGYALLLGILAGATYVIPFLGATLAALAAGVVGYVTTDSSWICAVSVVITMLALNQVFDSIITPKVVGESIGLHPLTVIFALMAGGALAGILGMLIAVPTAASIKVLLVHVFPKLQEELPKEDAPEGPEPPAAKPEDHIPPAAEPEAPPAEAPSGADDHSAGEVNTDG